MPITFSRKTSQGVSFLHTAPSPPLRQPPRPPGLTIGTLTIRGGRGCVLAQATRVVERGGLDIWSLMETSQMKTCPKNRWGYDVRPAAARPFHANIAQGGVGLGSQYQLNGKGGEATRSHRTDVVVCESVQKVSDG